MPLIFIGIHLLNIAVVKLKTTRTKEFVGIQEFNRKTSMKKVKLKKTSIRALFCIACQQRMKDFFINKKHLFQNSDNRLKYFENTETAIYDAASVNIVRLVLICHF
jgi:hypothetical protein